MAALIERASVGESEVSNQEIDDLIESLPKIPNWVKGHCYKYDGFWYWEDHLRPLLLCKKYFRFQDSDILLASFPKCGTTWLKAMMYTLVNRKSDWIGRPSVADTNNPHTLARTFENDLYVNKAIPDLFSMPAQRLFATHAPTLPLSDEVMNNSGCKIIYICRNSKDYFVSLWHFTNMLKPVEANTISLEEFFDSLSSGESFYGPFWDHVLQHWKMSLAMPEKIMFLSYEQIIEQPDHCVKKMEFMGCPFSSVEEDKGVVNEIVKMCSFSHLSQPEVNTSGRTETGFVHRAFFKRGEVGDSKNLLSSEMINKIDHIAQSKFSPHDLKI